MSMFNGKPLWRYRDACGVTRYGTMETFTDHGGTDVTYWFRRIENNTLDLVSGQRLRDAERIWKHDAESSAAVARAHEAAS
jgi:uncharacterized protein YfaT (DUF1175 family)